MRFWKMSDWSKSYARLCRSGARRANPRQKRHPGRRRVAVVGVKHMFNWSYDEMHREVCANLVYLEFTRIGGGKVPGDKTMGRLARQLGPEPVEKTASAVGGHRPG